MSDFASVFAPQISCGSIAIALKSHKRLGMLGKTSQAD